VVWAPHTARHKCTVCGDDDSPLPKPRDSARSALLTAVRYRRSGLALHPRRVLSLSLSVSLSFSPYRISDLLSYPAPVQKIR
jgi:hypothetical protein